MTSSAPHILGCPSDSPNVQSRVHVPVVRIYPGLNLPQVACNCGHAGPFGRTKEEAIELWNALCSPPALMEIEADIEKMRGDYVTSGSPGPLYGAGWSAACSYWANRLSTLISKATNGRGKDE